MSRVCFVFNMFAVIMFYCASLFNLKKNYLISCVYSFFAANARRTESARFRKEEEQGPCLPDCETEWNY